MKKIFIIFLFVILIFLTGASFASAAFSPASYYPAATVTAHCYYDGSSYHSGNYSNYYSTPAQSTGASNVGNPVQTQPCSWNYYSTFVSTSSCTGLIGYGQCQTQTVTATCTQNGNQVPVGTQYCVGQSYPGSSPVCTSSTQYGTCQSDGTNGVSNCGANQQCGYASSTNVSCYCNTPGCGSVCAAAATSTPTPSPTPTGTVCSSTCYYCSSGSCFSTTISSGTCASYGYSSSNSICTSCGSGATPTPTPGGSGASYYVWGKVWKDTNGNGVYDRGEGINGVNIGYTRTNSNTGLNESYGPLPTADNSANNFETPRLPLYEGSYIFGSYSYYTNQVITLTTSTLPAGYTLISSNPVSFAPRSSDIEISFQVSLPTTISGKVYNDANGNGVQDCLNGTSTYPACSGSTAETNYTAGASVRLNSGTPTTTDSSGNYSLSATSGTYNVTLTVPAGYSATTANPVSKSVPPSTVANFGITKAPPNCTGLSASPNPIYTFKSPNQSTLTMTGCPAGVNYFWQQPDYGTVTTTNQPTSTLTAPAALPQQTDSHPSLFVCWSDGSGCKPYGTTVTIIPTFSVSGSVFNDTNKNQYKDPSTLCPGCTAESAYSGSVTVSVKDGAGATVASQTTVASGNYTVTGIPAGNYFITTSIPTGYTQTYPQNLSDNSFNLNIGGPCAVGSIPNVNSGSYDANCNITGLNFGVTNSNPWIQSSGSDIRLDQGFSNPIPSSTACTGGANMSAVGSGTTPGLIFAGDGSYSFGQGQASADPYNWQVGGSNFGYPETYSPSKTGAIRTSYGYILNGAGSSVIDMASVSGCSVSGNDLNCTTTTWNNGGLPNGVYRANVPNGQLNLSGSGLTFGGNKNYVFLVNGNLKINEEIHVTAGSTSFFTSSGNIIVDQTVGSAYNVTTPNIEGYYSANNSFIIQGNNSNCSTADKRLNVAGSIVVNAGLSGGSLANQRDLCGNSSCPAFSITERGDFILNSPDLILNAKRIYQEVAP